MESQAVLPGLRSTGSVNPKQLPDVEFEEKVDPGIETLYEEGEMTRREGADQKALAQLFNTSDLMCDAATALIDDSFFRCFTSAPPDNWNFNWYLFPAWCIGFVVRHLVMFPLRLLLIFLVMTSFFAMFFPLQILMKDTPTRRQWERTLVQFIAVGWMAAWSAVVKYHGPRPAPRTGCIWVANHSSMIDYTILTAYMPFAAIMQLQPGWVGFLQKRVLSCLGCLWFHRTEVKDRQIVAQRMHEHIRDPAATPLLVFPEGTCVNNEYTVMFKRGAFDLGATVCPIAIKYNKIFVDAFWNSRRQPFSWYMFKLLTSWALVADVYFLPPQQQQEGESAVEFAQRVQKMIADVAQLRIVPWDGYLKYYNLASKRPQLVETRRRTIAKGMYACINPVE
eukprot:jgi/Ulvmu1/7482/UM037_0026.1